MASECWTQITITARGKNKAKEIYDAITKWCHSDDDNNSNCLSTLAVNSGVITSYNDIETSDVMCRGYIDDVVLNDKQIMLDMTSDYEPAIEPLYRAIEKHFNIANIRIEYTAVNESEGLFITNRKDLKYCFFVELDSTISDEAKQIFFDIYDDEHNGTYSTEEIFNKLKQIGISNGKSGYLNDDIDEARDMGIYINRWTQEPLDELF